MIVKFLKKVLYLVVSFILFYSFIYLITREVKITNIFIMLLALITFLIVSVIMYSKGIREIKNNNFNSLFFSIFPNILMRILFIHEYERESVFLRKTREKHFKRYLEDFDNEIQKSNKFQIVFYTLCYVMLWTFIVHMMFYILTNYYEFTLDIPNVAFRSCYLIILIMTILMGIIVAKKDR